jgi:hypothetical protein
MFSALGYVFGVAEGVGSCFQVLRSLTHFRRYRGRHIPFSYFARPKSFSADPRASNPVFMFCAPGLVFGDTEEVGSRFHVLRARTRFAAVPTALGPIFKFCAPGFIFGGTEGVRSRFIVLHSRTHFRRFRGRRVLFSCFALPDLFSAVPRASGPVFMFCAPGLIFGGTKGVGSNFYVLRSQTRFRVCRVRRVLFSCFALPDLFLTVPRASGPVFMFCAPELIFRSYEGVGSHFHVLCSRSRFPWYRGRRVPFSCFARPVSCSAVRRA